MSTFTDDDNKSVIIYRTMMTQKCFHYQAIAIRKKNITKTRENGYVNFTFKRIKLFQIEKLKKYYTHQYFCDLLVYKVALDSPVRKCKYYGHFLPWQLVHEGTYHLKV